MKFLLTNSSIDPQKISRLPYKVNRSTVGPFEILSKDLIDISDFLDHFSITLGYIRDLNLEAKDHEGQQKSAVAALAGSWPVPANITGSFSAVLINKRSFDLTICNDLIGIYPIYHLRIEKNIFITNSLILLGAVSNAAFDEAGIIQRCLGPEFANFGSRTILKGCKRLLPGEYLKMDSTGKIVERKFDNTLYSNLSEPASDSGIREIFWNAFKKEISYCLNKSDQVNVALSGGVDSRIVLGGISEEKRIRCLTYGSEDEYETTIAKRLSQLKNAEFRNFSSPDLYFAPREIVRDYTLQTEAVNICSWFEILENIAPAAREPILLGDMAEVLNGRNIKKFSSKSYRQSNFFKYHVLNQEYQFESSSKEKFEEWKESISKLFQRRYHHKKLQQFNFTSSPQDLVTSLREDLEEIFRRIEDHHLPYTELYDELFSWYIHSRIPMAKQVLICGSKFDSYCPSMSTNVLRITSSIHPNLRLSSRFINQLFKETKELRKLGTIPTSQAPIVPQLYPDWIKFPVWGLRSTIDRYLVRRMMKRKDYNSRYRLFKSINWARVYQNPNMEKNLRGYFENNYLGEDFFNGILKTCLRRKELTHWPFTNIGIITVSSLNLEMDIIETLRN